MDKVINTVSGNNLPDIRNLQRRDKILEEERDGQRIREVYDINGHSLYVWSFNQKGKESVYNPFFAEALGMTEEHLWNLVVEKDWDPFDWIRKQELLRIEVLQKA